MTDIDDTDEAEDANPLEKVFNIEPGSTPVFAPTPNSYEMSDRGHSLIDPTSGEMLPRVLDADTEQLEKEERIEDLHIDAQLDGIHSAAITAFEKSARMAEEVDPKFAARNAEVAAQYLNIALNAVNSRVDAKFKRQKVRLTKMTAGAPATVNNTNVFVGDRNALLDMFSKNAPQIIDITAEQK